MNLFLLFYVLIGSGVGIWFLTSALKRRDPNAVAVGWAFRLMVFPCCVLFWPVLLVMFQKSARTAMTKSEWRHADLRARRRHAHAWAILPLALAILVTLALLFRNPNNLQP